MPQPKFMQEQNLKDMLKNYAWQQEHERICSQITPDINEIKRLLNKKNELYFPTEPDTNALELKLKAMTHVPTTIEKTMTPAQLFATNHPAWAKTYYPETIAALCAIVRTLSNMGYQNREDYAEIVLNMVDDYQNDDYHYLQEFHSDAILEVKDRLGYPLLN